MSKGLPNYFVSAQRNTYNGVVYIEISCHNGDGPYSALDYSNPGMLVGILPDENYEGIDPREAVSTAIRARDAWRKKYPNEEEAIEIYAGCTGGSTCFFDETEELKTDDELAAWATERWEKLPRCDAPDCTEPLPGEYYYVEYDEEGQRCCSEICCDRLSEWQHKEMGDKVCFKCDEWVDADLATEIDTDEWVCQSCLAKYWENCDNCNERLEEGQIGLCDDCNEEDDDDDTEESE